jgi:hypothetical protein
LNGADLRRNLITVPSCDEHNTKKSRDDEYLWFIISVSHGLNECGQQMVSTKIKRNVERRPALGFSLLRDATPARIYDAHRGEWVRSAKANFDGSRFYRTLDMLGLALYRHHFKRRWLTSVKAFPHFAALADDTPARASHTWRQVLLIADVAFKDAPAYGDNPDAFFYQVYADDGDSASTLMRVTFYGSAVVTFGFTPKPMAGPPA